MPRIERMSRRVMLAGGAAWAAIHGTRGLSAAQTPPAGVDAAWSFTDDCDITVTTPQAPGRVVAQIGAAAALWDYGVRPIAVYGPQHLADGAPDPRIGNIDLNDVESVGELWEELPSADHTTVSSETIGENPESGSMWTLIRRPVSASKTTNSDRAMPRSPE